MSARKEKPAEAAKRPSAPIDLDCPKLPADGAGQPISRAALRRRARMDSIRIALALVSILERGIRAAADDIAKEADAAAREERKAARLVKPRKAKPKPKKSK